MVDTASSHQLGSGTFPPFAVESPGVIEEHFEGPVTVYPLEGGRTRVVYGPWQVTIRGLGAKAEGRVIARWEVETSWVVSMGFERVVRELSPGGVTRSPASWRMMGSSEAVGASERRWLSASELRMRVSELYMLSASELRFGGASELILGGASERRIQGGSERRWMGASEVLLGWRERGRLGGRQREHWVGSQRTIGIERKMGGSESRTDRARIDHVSLSIDEGESSRHEKR